MKTFVVTGGTGFLGSRLGVKLLSEKNTIFFIARDKNGEFAESRQTMALRKIDPRISFEKITITNNEGILRQLKGPKIDGVWHLAANLSFRKEDSQQVFVDNIGELQKSLKIAEYFSCPIYYISTAYVHGQNGGKKIYETILSRPRKFNNAYEESKFENEKIITEWGIRNENRFIVFRPSILIETEKAGEVSSFGYYSVIKALYKFKKGLDRWIKHNSFLSRIFFIRKNKNGKISLPLPFPYAPEVFLNLMPVNIAILWMTTIVSDQSNLGKIFHITNPYYFSRKEVTKQTMDGAGIRFIVFPATKFFVSLFFKIINFIGFLNKGVRRLAKSLNHYGFYMIVSNNYDMENTRRALGENLEKYFSFEKFFLRKITKNFIENNHH